MATPPKAPTSTTAPPKARPKRLAVRQWSYLGNKSQLLTWLWEATFQGLVEELRDAGTTDPVVADICSGSCSVGRMLAQRGVKVLSADQLYFSAVLANAYLGSADVETVTQAATMLNAEVNAEVDPADDAAGGGGYIHNTFTPRANRLYYTEENGRRIDAYRTKIEARYKDDPPTYYALLAALLHASSLHVNCPGHTRTFLKQLVARAAEPLYLDVRRLGDIGLGKSAGATWGTHDMLRTWAAERADIVYIDPPYTDIHYSRFYHVLETIARYDDPVAKGLTGMRDDAEFSAWSRRRTVRGALQTIIDGLSSSPGRRVQTLVMSYSTDGLMPETDIRAIMEPRCERLEVHRRSHYKYNNPNREAGTQRGKVDELLFVARGLKPAPAADE